MREVRSCGDHAPSEWLRLQAGFRAIKAQRDGKSVAGVELPLLSLAVVLAPRTAISRNGSPDAMSECLVMP
jgi:hypothetical protein